ncbi:MAG TPA: alpha-E domain-containing protein [Bryobacteraceae bacterium]|nr:alpha-E domain-containing protein [Bryobacteraceae bacterium]
MNSKPLLSRVADSLYWIGRYIERADNVARSVGVNLQMMLDLPAENTGQWQALVQTSGDNQIFRERYGAATQDNVIRFLVFDRENTNSIAVCANVARENARSVRDTISSEMWEQVNQMYLLINSSPSRLAPDALPEFFYRVRTECHLFQGLTDATMSHNEAWNFLRLGRKLERADKTTRILDVKYYMLLPALSDVGTPYDDVQWSAVLKSVSGFEMYRKRYGRIAPNRIVEFLLMDREFPRAVHYCINCADECLHAITGIPAGSFSCVSEQRLGLLRSELHYTHVDSILATGLHEFLDALQVKMNRIDTAILEDFFAVRADVEAATGSTGSGQR